MHSILIGTTQVQEVITSTSLGYINTLNLQQYITFIAWLIKA